MYLLDIRNTLLTCFVIDPESGDHHILYTLVYSKAVKGYRLKKRYKPNPTDSGIGLLADILEHAKTTKLDKTAERVST